jgi:hypothetical protein
LAGYNNYLLILENILPASSSIPEVILGTGGGPTYVTSGYTYNVLYSTASTATAINSTSTTSLAITGTQNSYNSGDGISAVIYLYNFTNSGDSSATAQAVVQTAASTYGIFIGSYYLLSNASAKTAVKVVMSSGNITSGTASLYGISS